MTKLSDLEQALCDNSILLWDMFFNLQDNEHRTALVERLRAQRTRNSILIRELREARLDHIDTVLPTVTDKKTLNILNRAWWKTYFKLRKSRSKLDSGNKPSE